MKDTKHIAAHVQYGNKKLPKTTMIFNSGPASDCPSRKLGLCQAGEDCYALPPERQYPACKPYRERQREITRTYTGAEIGAALVQANKRKRKPCDTFRYNESGDFETQADVQNMSDTCATLQENGIDCYGYTARTDLDLTPLMRVSRVNVSNDKGQWVKRGANRFRMVTSYTGDKPACKGDCRTCTLCKTVAGHEIEVLKH